MMKQYPFTLPLLASLTMAAMAPIGASAEVTARESYLEWGPGEAPNIVHPAKLTPEGRAALRPSRKAQTLPGPTREVLGGPLLAAEVAYANRAYPEVDIPIERTINAQRAFAAVEARGVGQGKNVPGQWTMIGPSTPNYPAVLSFSGHDYTTGGRITALAIAPDCGVGTRCRVWAAAAGGGVWRTDTALAGAGPTWTYISGSFATNAIGALTYDTARGTLYAGTGEPNASADSEAGMGVYKSTDGGDTWTALPGISAPIGAFTGGPFANGRSISSIAVDPTNANIIYVSTTRGVRGVSSVSSGGATATPPPTLAPPFGLWKSTDAGATFSFIWNGNASLRGVNRLALDPSNPNVIYAAAFQQGVWRSTDGGATFTQILTAAVPAENTDRAEFAITRLPNGNTRMYVGDGSTFSPASKVSRTDDAGAAAPVFINMTSAQNSNYCTGQCWYDNFVYSPAGYPDVVYLGGSFQYGEFGGVSNGRAVLLSTDAGATFTDMTWDASSDTAPNGLHPDHHALVTVPGNPLLFINGSDGGLVRSSGSVSNVAYQCSARGLSPSALTLCQQLLSRVPSHLYSMNKSMSTLQFQSLSVNPFNSKHLMGGTQDNGTFETTGSSVVWPQIMYGDGGQSGFSAGSGALRFNTFTGQGNDANFQNGDPTKWVVIGGPMMSSPESAQFYPPIIADPNPAAAGTIFQGSQSVWRTQDWGGSQAYLEANCAEFTTSAADPNCGDFVRLGTTTLTTGTLGTRSGGNVAALARTKADVGTLWAATTTGRVFVSKNADTTAASVAFTRIDSTATNSPGRFVSGIAVDPTNSNRAFVSYSGYNFNTPAQPGHLFEVTLNGTSATWVDRSFDLGDLPATGVAYDDVTGDLYASSDFGVMRLAAGSSSWVAAGSGLPFVEVAGLTIVPQARKIYAATHGRSAWGLTLP
jgi:hypothetical protein